MRPVVGQLLETFIDLKNGAGISELTGISGTVS